MVELVGRSAGHGEEAMARARTDVVIVGAGTSGAYLGWKLAERGFSCLILERDKLENLGTAIGPFHIEEEAFARFGIPLPQGDELLHRLATITMWPPCMKGEVTARLVTLDMDKPAFMRRLISYAREAGTEVLEETEFTDLVRERGAPAGVRAKGPEGELKVRCRLVVDASGIGGAVRTRAPATPWFENDPVADIDTLVVYMESWGDLAGDLKPDINSFLHFQGWYAPSYGDEMIVGVGMPASPEGARKRHRAFAATLPFSGEARSSTMGRVPYRRPPYSLVDNGLMVVGDAAFMNKPFSGEGVTSAFAACAIAADVAAEALRRDDLTRDALWPYNVRYFRDQGAKFAFLTALMPALVSLSPDEIDFLYSVPGVFSEEGTRALNLEYELRSDPSETLKALPALLKGAVAGKLRPASISRMARMAVAAGALRKLYEDYPEHPADFGAWIKKAMPLWKKADAERHAYFQRVLRKYS